jgi:hypothetical protein
MMLALHTALVPSLVVFLVPKHAPAFLVGGQKVNNCISNEEAGFFVELLHKL